MSRGFQPEDILKNQNIRRFLHLVSVELVRLQSNAEIYSINLEAQQKLRNFEWKRGIDELKSELDKLADSINFTLSLFWQNINGEVSVLKHAAQDYQLELSEYEVQYQNQEETIKNLEEKIGKLEVSIREKDSFISTLGSTCSNLLWKVSKNSETMKILLENGRFLDLFSIIEDVMKSFFDAFNESLPSARSNEVQFIISLVGILVNLTALPEGRRFVFDARQGREMIQQLVKYAPKFTDSNIQRMMLMAIFNISIHKQGTKLVLDEHDLFILLKKHLMGRGIAMKYVSLKLVQAITYNTDDAGDLRILFEEIPMITLIEIERESSEEERDLINKIRQRYLKLQNAKLQMP